MEVVQGAVDAAALQTLVQKVLTSGGGVESWDAQRLKLGLEGGVAVPIDLRDTVDFGRARVPGAMNVSAEDLDERLPELRALSADLVFYHLLILLFIVHLLSNKYYFDLLLIVKV